MAPGGEALCPRGPVAIFDSIHAVLAAERAFFAAGLVCDLVPVPRGLSSDCGMALLFRRADLETARSLLTPPPLGHRLRGIFAPGTDGYEPIASGGERR